MHPQGAPAAFGEDVEIAARLRRLDDAEAVPSARHVEVARIVAGDLQKDARIGAALIGLAGRMEEARAETEAGGDPLRAADRDAYCLQRLGVRGVALDIGEQRAVIAGYQPVKMRLEIALERGPRTELGELPGVPLVGEELDAVAGKDRTLRRQLPCLLIGFSQLTSLDLARLDIGLVEGIASDDRADDGDDDLPTEELLAEPMRVAQGDANDRLAGTLQGIDGAILRGVGGGIEAKIGEEPIAAIELGRAERLGSDRYQPFAMLARRFGDELFQPCAEFADPRRGDDRQLVASGLRQHAHDRAERDARIVGRRYAGGTGIHHEPARLEKPGNVEPHRRRGYHAEIGKDRITAADAGIAVIDAAKAIFLGHALQRRARVGHGDEMPPRSGGADRRLGTREEIFLEDGGLERAARLARHDEERPRDVELGLMRPDLGGVSRIEDVQLGV